MYRNVRSAIHSALEPCARDAPLVDGRRKFLPLNDDSEDTGIAGVDIYKMDSDGRAVEHWDTLQPVGDPNNSAPWLAPNVPRANPNGMF